MVTFYFQGARKRKLGSKEKIVLHPDPDEMDESRDLDKIDAGILMMKKSAGGEGGGQEKKQNKNKVGNKVASPGGAEGRLIRSSRKTKAKAVAKING